MISPGNRFAATLLSHLLGKVDAFSCRELFLDVGEPPGIPPIKSSGRQAIADKAAIMRYKRGFAAAG